MEACEGIGFTTGKKYGLRSMFFLSGLFYALIKKWKQRFFTTVFLSEIHYF